MDRVQLILIYKPILIKSTLNDESIISTSLKRSPTVPGSHLSKKQTLLSNLNIYFVKFDNINNSSFSNSFVRFLLSCKGGFEKNVSIVKLKVFEKYCLWY